MYYEGYSADVFVDSILKDLNSGKGLYLPVDIISPLLTEEKEIYFPVFYQRVKDISQFNSYSEKEKYNYIGICARGRMIAHDKPSANYSNHLKVYYIPSAEVPNIIHFVHAIKSPQVQVISVLEYVKYI